MRGRTPRGSFGGAGACRIALVSLPAVRHVEAADDPCVASTAFPARTRADHTLPLRGRPLRERYVLGLIALDRAVHFVVLAVLAVAFPSGADADARLARPNTKVQ